LHQIPDKMPKSPLQIQFHDHGNRVPEDGPDGTLCRPDIIVYDKLMWVVEPSDQPISSRTRSQIKHLTSNVETHVPAWSQLEATAEFYSQGDSQEQGLLKAMSYTAYHLLARPDRVFVPGFYFGLKQLSLILTGASGTCHVDLQWNSLADMQLLRNFVYCIMQPGQNMVDPTMTRNPNGTFNFDINGKAYNHCEPLWFGRPIGRRTTIFLTGDPQVPIIKEQYMHNPSAEIKNLKIIHKTGGASGIVRANDHQEFREGDMVIACTIATSFGGKARFKSRLALEGLGTPITETRTPYEFLTRLYDLLEG
jgi:hypothetical protein